MGNIQSNTKVNFEYMQNCIEHPDSQTIINVLDNDSQHCLIHTTVHAREEEETVNSHLKVIRKHKQLLTYGFKNVKIYFGGLFEWLCLQDIYGKEQFKTNGDELDILKYK
jgi:hypothetical protein